MHLTCYLLDVCLNVDGDLVTTLKVTIVLNPGFSFVFFLNFFNPNRRCKLSCIYQSALKRGKKKNVYQQLAHPDLGQTSDLCTLRQLTHVS